jgi:hypothetical protein
MMGDARATWEVLGEILGDGRRKKRKGAACGFLRKDKVRLTDKGEIEGFCEF